MDTKRSLINASDVLAKLIRYNLKIIFANKFIYFSIAAVAFFLLVTIMDLFSESNPTAGSVYYLLLLPGLLLIFYPTVFGIQNDVDARMIEILFGIPNYRYKVWLVRMVLTYLVAFVILLVLSVVSRVALVRVSVVEMAYQLMFPVCFLGCAAFMFSTLIRNGNGTAVVMVVLGVAFWISRSVLQHTRWDVFLNPFLVPSDANEAIWASVVLDNRLYLVVGAIVCVLLGLLLLQKREKFV